MPEQEEQSFVFRDKRRSADDEKGADDHTTSPAESVDSSVSPTPAEPDGQPDKKQREGAPEISFSTFVLSLSSSAAMSLGGYQDPVSGHVPKNLDMAKQTIDILGIIEEKTKGNLDDEEAKLLKLALYELRMRYVEETKKG